MVSNVLHGAVKSNNGGQDLDLAAASKVQHLQGSSVQGPVELVLKSTSDHEKRRGRPSKEKLAEVNALEVRIHMEVACYDFSFLCHRSCVMHHIPDTFPCVTICI